MAMDFAKAPTGNDSYPKRSYDGQEDQSYGFVDAFKLQTGNTRGVQGVGYGNTKINGAENSITVGDSILLDGNNSIIEVTSDDGSKLGIGLIPDGTNRFGFYAKDSAGNVITTIVDGTQIMNDTFNDRVLIGKSVGRF